MKKIVSMVFFCISFASIIFGENSMKKNMKIDLYEAVYQEKNEWVIELLRNGADPNICSGVGGWFDGNPLCVLTGGLYYTYPRIIQNVKLPSPLPDIAVLQTLVQNGANIDIRPYIWFRVYFHGNDKIINLITYSWNKQRDRGEITDDEFTIGLAKEIDGYVQDSNRLLQALIDAGANPDMKGHPKPFETKTLTQLFMNDSRAKKYFIKGTRPINEAIKKGMYWESQVDLLLRYVKLDEDSLKAAEESKDKEMIDKIQKLWEKQNRE